MTTQSVFRVRASAWSSLFECAYRFEAIHLLGMRNVVGLRAALGTAIHAGTAAYDQSVLDGAGLTADDAAGAFIDKLHDPSNEYNPASDDPRCARPSESVSRSRRSIASKSRRATTSSPSRWRRSRLTSTAAAGS
ncbi:hypothetical protein [Burkholderia glumae]|uniref:hypothetical protein n=1 Tax=Burkholderia glumae TaxID=337 RepID=UPI0039A70CDF